MSKFCRKRKKCKKRFLLFLYIQIFYIDKLYRRRKQPFYCFILLTELKSFCHRGQVLFFTNENYATYESQKEKYFVSVFL